MELLIKPRKEEEHGPITLDTRWSAESLEYVRFRHCRLGASERFQENSAAHELCLVILSGIVSVHLDGQKFVQIGGRMSVFEQVPPHALYLPDHSEYLIEAHTDAEIGICGAPGQGGHKARLISPGQVKLSTRGEGANVRHIHDILPETENADSLLVVEVYTPAGNWSSYPPHKHDTDDLPEESLLEESYYHRLNPARGFGLQRVYTDDRSIDESMAFGDGNCVVVPKGYHPVGAPYGCDLYYLNVMAGPKRVWKFRTDPDFEWLLP